MQLEFDEEQLAARLAVAERITNLQSNLVQFSGMTPIMTTNVSAVQAVMV